MRKEKSKDIKKIDLSKLATLPPEDILQKFINPIANECAEELQSSFLLMYYSQAEKAGMYSPDVSLVYTLLRRVDKTKPLAVFIHSGGGDIHTAYKLVKLFHKCCEYKSIIPEFAKSAATLVAIGADKILMSPIAELGPLDPIIQFENGTEIPAFAIRNAPKVLEREIESCKDPEVRKLKAEHILGPIAVKIDPYVLADVSDTPELAKRYGKKILLARGYKGPTAERIVNRLTELGAPSHGYVVDLEEAKNLELRAEEMDEKVEALSSLLLHVLRMYESACRRNGHPISRPMIKMYLIKPEKRKVPKEKTEAKEKKKEYLL